ncbi:MAG: hypothetical protein MR597_01125, partial [Bacteroidales bacterium]|nr:hypothetical protein [Bacteroidales bacterium]
PTEAMNFMIQLMDKYKTNADLLDNMNKVSPKDAKNYDYYYQADHADGSCRHFRIFLQCQQSASRNR